MTDPTAALDCCGATSDWGSVCPSAPGHPGSHDWRSTDPRTAALAEALHLIRHMHGNLWPPTDACGCKDEAAAILAALPPDWCGHGPATREQRDLDDKPFCPSGYAQRYHAIGRGRHAMTEDPRLVPLTAALESVAASILAALPLASEQAADREITRLNARIVDLNAEVLDRMDQWNRDSLARDELARQQVGELARLRIIEEAARTGHARWADGGCSCGVANCPIRVALGA